MNHRVFINRLYYDEIIDPTLQYILFIICGYGNFSEAIVPVTINDSMKRQFFIPEALLSTICDVEVYHCAPHAYMLCTDNFDSDIRYLDSGIGYIFHGELYVSISVNDKVSICREYELPIRDITENHIFLLIKCLFNPLQRLLPLIYIIYALSTDGLELRNMIYSGFTI